MGGFVYVIFLCSQGLLYSRIPPAALAVGSAVVTLAGLLMAYDIVRYALFQVEVYVGRGAVYSSAILLLVGGYLILVGLVGKLVKVIGGNLNLFLTILAAFVMLILLLVLLVSGSLKRRLRTFIDRNFYKGRYDYREQWLRFSEELSSLLSLDEFLPGFLQMVMDTLDVRSAAVLLQRDAQGDFLLAEAKNLSVEDFQISEKSEFLEWLFILSQPVDLEDNRFNESPVPEVQSQRDRLKNLGFTAAIPLITKRKLIGLLVLGPRKSGDTFSTVDLELLEAIGNHLSVAILNAKLSEELVLSKEWEFINKISSFVVHDLKNLVSSLSMLLQNAGTNMDKPEFRENMLTTIAGTVEKMKGLMNRMTTMPKEIQLNLQPQDLNSIVRGVISKLKGSHMPGIQYVENLHPLPLVSVDRDYAERILRNLIVNALEAMGKEGTLRVSTRFSENGSLTTAGETLQFVEVEIADTGTGMGDNFVKHKLFRPFQTTKDKGLGIGLYQCKEAVEAHGGRIEVRSKEGQGSIFLIRLPVNHPNSMTVPKMGGDENRKG
jgi:putative PEP-CTERM system histidine kinase